jgi:hypothetical protein
MHALSRYICGDFFLKSHTVLKTVAVYDKYKRNICMVYAKLFVFFNQMCFYGRKNNEIATSSLNQHVYMHLD